MEQLLQEAEHWSVEHTELSKLIKSYQESQNDINTLKNNGTHSLTQTNNEAATRAGGTSEETETRHIFIAFDCNLLENECQILEHRVELLPMNSIIRRKSLCKGSPQINHEQNDKEQKPPEADKVKAHEKTEVEGTFHKRDQFFRSPDICHNKKAHNNQFNTRIAKRALVVKRPASSLS